MSIWSDDPEWFDEWIEKKALAGEFGPEAQNKVEAGELLGYELWPEHLELGTEATEDYILRWVE